MLSAAVGAVWVKGACEGVKMKCGELRVRSGGRADSTRDRTLDQETSRPEWYLRGGRPGEEGEEG